MAIVAPYCNYKKTNFKIGIVLLIVAAIWFAYDGFYSEKFKSRHTVDGKPDPTLVFHRKSPPYFAAAAAVLAVMFFIKKDKKVVAEENELILSGGRRISYSSLESIDRTAYAKKGFFTLEYLDGGQKRHCRISNRDFDNLDAVLELLTAKLSG